LLRETARVLLRAGSSGIGCSPHANTAALCILRILRCGNVRAGARFQSEQGTRVDQEIAVRLATARQQADAPKEPAESLYFGGDPELHVEAPSPAKPMPPTQIRRRVISLSPRSGR